MSSSRRPAASEDSILASLERGSSGAQAQRSWLIIGGTAAAILTAMLAWIAYNNATSVRTLPVSAVKRPAPVPEQVATRDIPPLQAAKPATLAAEPAPLAQAQAAAIVDEPPVAAAAAPERRPSLVMLPPEEVHGAKPPPPRAELAAVSAEPAPPAPVTAKPPPAAVKPAPARMTERVAAAEKRVRTMAAARPAIVKTAALRTGSAQASARKARAGAAPKPVVIPDVDSDVALLSAIVAHSSRHAAERAQQESCKGKKCSTAESSEP